MPIAISLCLFRLQVGRSIKNVGKLKENKFRKRGAACDAGTALKVWLGQKLRQNDTLYESNHIGNRHNLFCM